VPKDALFVSAWFQIVAAIERPLLKSVPEKIIEFLIIQGALPESAQIKTQLMGFFLNELTDTHAGNPLKKLKRSIAQNSEVTGRIAKMRRVAVHPRRFSDT
tara:strand:- start:354 stop:656 length:303 start_codon:yes stop_codon:yes gene_type:complete